MKNREKAEECAKKYSTRYDTITAEGNIIEDSNYLNCLRSAMAMAEWKDTIHKTEIDRLYNAIKDYLPIEVRRKVKRVFFNE